MPKNGTGRDSGGNNGQGSNWITRRRRLAIYIADGFTCSYCRSDLRGVRPGKITLDHIVPRSLGGTNDSTNLITACLSCNSRRGSMTLELFLMGWTTVDQPAATAPALVKYAQDRELNMVLADALLGEWPPKEGMNDGSEDGESGPGAGPRPMDCSALSV